VIYFLEVFGGSCKKNYFRDNFSSNAEVLFDATIKFLRAKISLILQSYRNPVPFYGKEKMS